MNAAAQTTGRILGISAGSGLSKLLPGTLTQVNTKFGEAQVIRGELGGKPFFFIPRHGPEHTIPPHMINHPANMVALVEECGATDILSIAAVGTLQPERFLPGDMAMVRDLVRLTPRPTLFDTYPPHDAKHGPMDQPYSSLFIQEVQEAASHSNIPLKDDAVLIDTSGPTFETKAENRIFASWHIDLAGMTSTGETIILNEMKLERDIRNATLALVGNYGTGIVDEPVDHKGVEKIIKQLTPLVNRIIERLIQLIG